MQRMTTQTLTCIGPDYRTSHDEIDDLLAEHGNELAEQKVLSAATYSPPLLQ